MPLMNKPMGIRTSENLAEANIVSNISMQQSRHIQNQQMSSHLNSEFDSKTDEQTNFQI